MRFYKIKLKIIDWQLKKNGIDKPILSEKDLVSPGLSDVESNF